MGRESRVAFMPASSGPGGSPAPMENSPPGIQTIFGGAGPGGGVLLGTVGLKATRSPGRVFSSAAFALEYRGQRLQYAANVTIATTSRIADFPRKERRTWRGVRGFRIATLMFLGTADMRRSFCVACTTEFLNRGTIASRISDPVPHLKD